MPVYTQHQVKDGSLRSGGIAKELDVDFKKKMSKATIN